jgi:hypothetical protein
MVNTLIGLDLLKFLKKVFRSNHENGLSGEPKYSVLCEIDAQIEFSGQFRPKSSLSRRHNGENPKMGKFGKISEKVFRSNHENGLSGEPKYSVLCEIDVQIPVLGAENAEKIGF